MPARDQPSIEVWYGWVVILASLAISMVAQAAPNILFVTLKPVASSFDWPRAMPSMAVSLLMLGTGVGGIFMGWWMDRRGIMYPVLFGGTMISVGAMMMASAQGVWGVFVACGIFMGLFGQAAMIAPLIANATRWFDRNRGLAVAIIASSQGVAGAVWAPITRSLSEEFGWRLTYHYYGWFALLTIVPLAFVLKRAPPINPPSEADRSSARGQSRVLDLPATSVQTLLCLAAVGCCAGMAMPIVHLISHTTDLGYSSVHAAQLFSLLFAVAFVSRILFGLLADKIGAARTQLIGSSCQAVMLLTFALVSSLPALYVAAALFGIGFAGIMPCYALLIRQWFPQTDVGWRVAMLYLFAALGMALGGWLGGVVFDYFGSYRNAFLLGFAFNVMNLFVISGLYWRSLRLRLQPTPA